METKRLTIWGREFNLKIVFDCYSEEKVTENQQQTLNKFLENPSEVDSVLETVFEYVKRFDSNIQTDNIFKYVIPQALFIQRTKDNNRIIALFGAFKFDLEHGIAIVFRNEVFWKIGNQDIVL